MKRPLDTLRTSTSNRGVSKLGRNNDAEEYPFSNLNAPFNLANMFPSRRRKSSANIDDVTQVDKIVNKRPVSLAKLHEFDRETPNGRKLAPGGKLAYHRAIHEMPDDRMCNAGARYKGNQYTYNWRFAQTPTQPHEEQITTDANLNNISCWSTRNKNDYGFFFKPSPLGASGDSAKPTLENMRKIRTWAEQCAAEAREQITRSKGHAKLREVPKEDWEVSAAYNGHTNPCPLPERFERPSIWNKDLYHNAHVHPYWTDQSQFFSLPPSIAHMPRKYRPIYRDMAWTTEHTVVRKSANSCKRNFGMNM